MTAAQLVEFIFRHTGPTNPLPIVVNVDPYGDKLVSVDHAHLVDGQIVLDFAGDYYVRDYAPGE